MNVVASSPNEPRRLAVLLEYDGGSYAGSQLQVEAPTVQSVLEEAIESVTGEALRASFAGRTDAGVHARGQVASFVTTSRLAGAVLLRALNARLPRDVAVLAVAEVAMDFDPRRHAVRRHYRYLVDNREVRGVFERDRVWPVTKRLDVDSMRTAAQSLVGTQDFAAFASKLPDAEASTVREIFSFEVFREGTDVTLDVVGSAFLPHQVRRMVGALAEVGKGKTSVEAFGELLGGPPASSGFTAPAHGLYLMGVEYGWDVFGGVTLSTDNPSNAS